MLRTALTTALLMSLMPGCGGDCAKKAEKSMTCPEGYVGYGRRLPNRNKDWLPVYSLTDLALWASGDSYTDSGRCESACVPISLGEPQAFGECDTFQPCGGDVLGDWRWEPYACPYEVPNDMFTGCTEAVQSLAAGTDGTLTFEEDGTVRYTGTETYNVDTVAIPGTCLDALGSCQDLFGVGDSCAGDPLEGCTCTGERQTGAVDWQGTWVKLGAQIVITNNEVETTVDYCVNDGQLVLDWEADDQEVRVREMLFSWSN